MGVIINLINFGIGNSACSQNIICYHSNAFEHLTTEIYSYNVEISKYLYIVSILVLKTEIYS